MRATRFLTPAAIAAGTFLFFTGSAHADVIDGDGTDESFDGSSGADTINGNGGSDHLHGEEGDDVVNGGEGDDEHVAGDEGDDVVDGGPGDERAIDEDSFGVDGGEGNDVASGGEGDDDVTGGPGDDVVDGGPGDDLVIGDGDDECSVGGEGTADPDDCPGDDSVTGGDGDDVLIGDGSSCFVDEQTEVQLQGVTAAGTIDDDCAGDDDLDGGTGDDVLLGDGSTLDGCDGEGLPFFLGTDAEDDCLPGGDDVLSGGDGDDDLDGGQGDDVLDGGDGDDILYGDSFLELLLLGAFDGQEIDGDLYEAIRAAAAGLREELFDPELTDEEREQIELILFQLSLLLPGGDDELTGGPGVDVLLGMGGDDVVCGDADDLFVLGGTGTDIPCANGGTHTVVEGGTVTGTVAPLRGLDDEDLEVDEEGNPNPFFYVVVVAPTKGTLVLDPTTGAYTYTAFEGAEGTDTFQIGLTRRIAECQDLDVDVDVVVPTSFDEVCGIEAGASAIVTINGDDFIQKVALVTVEITKEPIVIGDLGPAPRVAPAELARTGADTTALAIGGMALVAAGLLAQAEADRRRRRLAYAAR